jgi:hypothetical protein
MFNDLVAELHHAVIADMYPWDVTLYVRAADEIERLRAAGDALHAAIRNHDLREEHLRAWQEARRD